MFVGLNSIFLQRNVFFVFCTRVDKLLYVIVGALDPKMILGFFPSPKP